MLSFLFSTFLILNGLFSVIVGESGCPPAEDIAPCKCENSPAAKLTCAGFTEKDHLLEIFEASKGYTFQEVHIVQSSLLYIPVKIFDYAFIKEFYMNNSVAGRLFFDRENNVWNENKHLYKVQIETTHVNGGFLSTNLSSFTNLREVMVNFSQAEYIPGNYGYLLPNGLKKLTFSRNIMQKISPGAFTSLTNLETFVVERNRLFGISRDIFPTPFNVKTLSFQYNLIQAIPDNMFHDMPNLQFLSMEHNLFTTLPEAAFRGRLNNVPYINLEDNPLICDCSMLWLINDKPKYLGGTCFLPFELSHRTVQDLKPEELSC